MELLTKDEITAFIIGRELAELISVLIEAGCVELEIQAAIDGFRSQTGIS